MHYSVTTSIIMKAHLFFFLLLTLNASCNGDISNCETSSVQIHYHLRYNLLCDYSADIRPKIYHRNATKVFVKMVVQSYSYDMYSNSIAVNNWLHTTWVDDHLKWNPSDYEDVDRIHFRSDEIWTPDLSLFNKYHQDSVQRIFDSNVDCLVFNTGKVTCVPPNEHEALCTADLRKYPYDTQKCTLRLGSWIHAGEVIDFQFSDNPVSTAYTSDSEWKLLYATVDKTMGNYSCCPNNTYPSLLFNFYIQRLASSHEATVIVPAVAIIIVTLFVFCLSAAEIERFYLLIASILFHFLFIQNLSWLLPNVGDYPPNIMIFARDSLVLCVVEFIVTLVLRRMIKTPVDNVGWISGMIGILIQSRVGQAILVFDNTIKAIAIAKGEEDGANIIERSQTNDVDYIIFAKLLDRLLCVIFLIIYISMFFKLVL